MQFTGTLLSAFAFAVDKHRYQRRKDRRLSPYVNHLVDVANVLWNVGKVRDEDILIASILHDTLEDTNTKPEEILEQFGPVVLGYVEEVSDDKSKPKDVRKRIQILTASSKSQGAKQISLADKIANLKDLAERPPANWPAERRKAYAVWAQEVSMGLQGANPLLEAQLEEVIQLVMNKLDDRLTRMPQQAQSI
ncbi:MAG: HD domain-containing protein [Bacteroidota bacterium]